MFRHTVRQIIKFGEFPDFVAALKEFNTAAPAAGLPAYRAWRSEFGNLNEVFTEADYESLDSHVAAWQAVARGNETVMAAFRKMTSHIASGVDYPLMPIEL